MKENKDILTIFFFFFVVCFCANAQTAKQLHSTCKRYRHIIVESTGRYIEKNTSYADSFDYNFRPKFSCRYLDDDWFLCRIDSIIDTLCMNDIPFADNIEIDSTNILNLSVEIVEWYRSRESPVIDMFFSEEMFKDEFLNGKNHGLREYVSYIDSCINDTSKIFINVLLLVKKGEISEINYYCKNNCHILCNDTKKLDNHIFFSDMFFPLYEYESSELYDLIEWRNFLYKRISELKTTERKCLVPGMQ